MLIYLLISEKFDLDDFHVSCVVEVSRLFKQLWETCRIDFHQVSCEFDCMLLSPCIVRIIGNLASRCSSSAQPRSVPLPPGPAGPTSHRRRVAQSSHCTVSPRPNGGVRDCSARIYAGERRAPSMPGFMRIACVRRRNTA